MNEYTAKFNATGYIVCQDYSHLVRSTSVSLCFACSEALSTVGNTRCQPAVEGGKACGFAAVSIPGLHC